MKRNIALKTCAVLMSVIITLFSAGCNSGVKVLEIPSADTTEGLDADSNFSSAYIGLSLSVLKRAAETENKDNLLFSPLSIINALGMVANGADGETLRQLVSTWGNLEPAMLNKYLKNYNENLPQTDKCSLSLANSVWMNKNAGAEFNEDYLKTVSGCFRAEMFLADFNSQTEKSINKWVKKKTDGHIKEIINNLSPDSITVLLNALNFDAKWTNEYEKSDVEHREFNNYSGESSNIEMMFSDEDTYLKAENAEGFMKNYSGGNFAFAALMPNEGTDIYDFIETLSGDKLSEILAGAEHREVIAGIPKFSFEHSLDMKSILKNMGVINAFDGEIADFSNLGKSTRGNIFISDVIHKAYIAADESGTEASAATAVILKECEMLIPTDAKTVYLDRPFIFMILDRENNIPVFIGVVTDIKSV